MLKAALVILVLTVLLAPASAQEVDPKDQKVYTAIATQFGMLEMAKITLQVQLEAAQAEIARLKKENQK